MTDNRTNVAIVGAGIGGLTAAIALRNAGVQVQVLERVPEIRTIGFGITLQTVEDAIVLADVYRKSTTVEDWLLEFSRHRKRRIHAVVTESRHLGFLAQGSSCLTRFVRNHVLPRMPKALHDAQMRKLLWFHGVRSVQKGESQAGTRRRTADPLAIAAHTP